MTALSQAIRRPSDKIIGLVRDAAGYGAVSVLGLAVDWGTLSYLYRGLGVNYLIAASVSFLLGLGCVYFYSVKWVFTGRRKFNARTEFLGFALTGAIGLGLNAALLAAFVTQTDLAPDLAKAPTAVFVFLFNFVSRRLMFTSK